MALAKCIKPCFDNQATRFYDRGQMVDIEPDSPLAKTKCFRFVKEDKPRTEDPMAGESEEKRGPGRPPKPK